MPKFTSDWFSHHIADWEMWLSGLKGLPYLDFLEIGSYEGRSAIWLLENIINHETCRLTCVDSFFDQEYETINGISLKNQFLQNIYPFAQQGKLTVFQNESFDALQELIKMKKQFDFIYIDGCHMAKSVLEDAVFSFRLLKNNGIMIFDDFNWNIKQQLHEVPRLAITSFISVYSNYMKILFCGDQLVVQKL